MNVRLVFELVLGAIIILLIFVCAILGMSVRDLYEKGQTGKIDYREIGEEKKIERKIKEKFKKLDEMLEKPEEDKEYRKFKKLLNDNMNYTFLEKEDETEKENYKGKKNFPVFIDKMPDMDYEDEYVIQIQLRYRRYIELLQNRIIHNANYILQE